MAATEEGVPPAETEPCAGLKVLDQSMPLSVVIFGATGDLAKKKLFPALYQLMLLGHMPKHINIVGYGRRAVKMEEFIPKQCAMVKQVPELPFEEFSSRIKFHAGGYDAPESYSALNEELAEYEAGKPGNRLFFLSVPPTVFGACSEMISSKVRAVEPAFTHLIIEKPFGRDTASFNELNDCTSSLFKESQLFRIDHYLGKEVVLNLVSLRFANQVYEPIWNKDHIESVEINFKEDLGTGGRGGYFDGFGIIRDIMQNHLLQVFTLIAMEPPAVAGGEAQLASKVDLLKQVKALHYDAEGAQCFLGQFTGNSWTVGADTHTETGYLEDETVPEGSKCPTFASVLLEVDNERWAGVPFLVKAGKGLDERMAEVRVHFKPKAYNSNLYGDLPGNELVLRIQPNEALYLKSWAKEPGLDHVLKPMVMDMKYSTTFPGAYVADAYERMFLNAAKGDNSLFVSEGELIEAWRIFTPLLHDIDEQRPDPVPYKFGSLYPPGYEAWSAAKGVKQPDNWVAGVASKGEAELTELFKSLDTEGKGFLGVTEVTALARQYYDGREPTEKKVTEIMSRMGHAGELAEGKISLVDFLKGSSAMKNAFGYADTEPREGFTASLDSPRSAASSPR